MSSGNGLHGKSRCFVAWVGLFTFFFFFFFFLETPSFGLFSPSLLQRTFSSCVASRPETATTECLPFREDYFECLHHAKEKRRNLYLNEIAQEQRAKASKDAAHH